VRDAAGEPRVLLFYLPPHFEVPHLPHRQYHRTVEEFGYVFAGELPHWEYREAGQQHGTFVRHRPGLFTHRLPGSIHGLEPGATSRVGCTRLIIRTGTGNWIGEPDFEDETVTVPYEPRWRPRGEPVEGPPGDGGVVVDWPDLRILDVERLDWEEKASFSLVKVLARDAERRPLVQLQYVAPGFTAPTLPERHYHVNAQYDLPLWGEFPMAEYASADAEPDVFRLRAGHFVHRRPGEIHGLVPGASSPTGVCTLQWYTDAELEPAPGAGGTFDATER
jgi:hypothetical protein